MTLTRQLTSCLGKNYKNSGKSLENFKFCNHVFKESKRFQGTNLSAHNPSANIRNEREREPGTMDLMTRSILRPCLPESITPPWMRVPKDAPPWPYREKGYSTWQRDFFDNTVKRFDENTRFICVEGNIGSGVSEFAKNLAKELQFHHVKEPSIEDIVVDRYGIDKRDYYHLFPERFCLFDSEMFFAAPNHPMVNVRAFCLFFLKVEAYANAMAHLLNTGDGVILERSFFTDIGFTRAMHEKKFVSDYYAAFYPKIRQLSIDSHTLMPHLYIYLDVPVSKCMENIKKRGRPYENNGKVIDYDYLSAIQEETLNYFKVAGKDSEILTLDWKKPAHIDDVLEEIYKLDFTYDWNKSDRFYEWNTLAPEGLWNEYRFDCTNKVVLLDYFTGVMSDVPELIVMNDERMQLRFVMDKILPYSAGYNRKKGDSWRSILWNWSQDRLAGGPWVEYLLAESFWNPIYLDDLHYEKPNTPNIPEEEFEPRRFDPKTLENWDHH